MQVSNKGVYHPALPVSCLGIPMSLLTDTKSNLHFFLFHSKTQMEIVIQSTNANMLWKG